MSNELLVIPRGELQRALDVTAHNTRSGGAILTASAVSAGVVLLVSPFTPMTAVISLGAVVGCLIGGIKLRRALRASSVIRAKLRVQELPPARVMPPANRP